MHPRMSDIPPILQRSAHLQRERPILIPLWEVRAFYEVPATFRAIEIRLAADQALQPVLTLRRRALDAHGPAEASGCDSITRLDPRNKYACLVNRGYPCPVAGRLLAAISSTVLA
jgi:hypothetical protein